MSIRMPVVPLPDDAKSFNIKEMTMVAWQESLATAHTRRAAGAA